MLWARLLLATMKINRVHSGTIVDLMGFKNTVKEGGCWALLSAFLIQAALRLARPLLLRLLRGMAPFGPFEGLGAFEGLLKSTAHSMSETEHLRSAPWVLIMVPPSLAVWHTGSCSLTSATPTN